MGLGLAGSGSFLLLNRGIAVAGSQTLLTGISVVGAVAHEAEFPNWFKKWCDTCQTYQSPQHICTTPGQQTVEEARGKLEHWLTPPYTFED